MEIPQAILDKARDLIDTYGENFAYHGLYQDRHVFQFVFPEGMKTGFPYFYLFDEFMNEVEVITGMKALDLWDEIFPEES